MTDEPITALGGHVLNGPCPICSQDPDVIRMRAEQKARLQVIIQGGGVLARVAELHQDEGGFCDDCADDEGVELEYQSWPCRTAELLINSLDS